MSNSLRSTGLELVRGGVALALLGVFAMAHPSDELAPAPQPKPKYAPGVLIVKFKEPVAEELKDALVRGEPLHTVSASKSLDSLNAECGVKNMRMLFRGFEVRDASGGVSRIEGMQEHMERIRAKFPARVPPPGPVDVPDMTTFFRLEIDGEMDVMQAVTEYQADPDVEHAQPNYLYEFFWDPDDHYYNGWGTWDQDYWDQWGVRIIECGGTEGAWEKSRGAGIVVAVIDTGVDWEHEDIAENIWINEDEIPDNGLDDDENGCIDDVRGWNFVEEPEEQEPNDPRDRAGHGTHLAGIVAAPANNGPQGDTGIVGVAPEAKIMAIRAGCIKYVGGDSPAAIEYAVDNGADVLSCSWGKAKDPWEPKDYAVEAAILEAHAQGCVLVFAAGNSNLDVTHHFFPQYMNEVITVAATDHVDTRSGFSNWGWQIDVAAPGGDARGGEEMLGCDVLSLKAAEGECLQRVCFVGERYYRGSGTSCSCPFVSGLAALILSASPDFTNEEVRQVIRLSADDLGPSGKDDWYGYGRINATQALDIESVCTAFISYPHTGNIQSKNYYGYVDIIGTASGPDFASYKLEYANKHLRDHWTQIAAGTDPVTDSYLGTFHFSNLPDGRYIVRLTVSDTAGQDYEFEVGVPVITGRYACWIEGDERPGPVRSAPFAADLDRSLPGQEVGVGTVSMPGGCRGGFFCLNADWSKRWCRSGCSHYSSPALAELDTTHPGLEIAVGSQEGYLHLLHADDGSPVWSMGPLGSAVKGSPAIADIDPSREGPEIAFTDQEYLYLVNQRPDQPLQPTFCWYLYIGSNLQAPVVAELDLDAETEGLEIAVVGGGRLYIVRCDGTVYREIEIPSVSLRGTPAVADLDPDHEGPEIAIGSSPGGLYVLYPDGTIWREFELGAPPTVAAKVTAADLVPWREGPEILAACEDGSLFLLSPSDDCLCWQFWAGGRVESCPAVADLDPAHAGFEVAFASYDAKVYVLHGDDGSLFWAFDTWRWLDSSPIVADVDPDVPGLEMVLGSAAGFVHLLNFPGTCPAGAAPWPMYAQNPSHAGCSFDAVHVDDGNDTGVEYGTVFHPFDTIEEGLSLAATWGMATVKVGPGTYSPPGAWYYLPASLALEGSTTLSADEELVNPYTQTVISGAGIDCRDPNPAVRNLTLEAGPYSQLGGIAAFYTGPGDGAAGLSVEGCVITGSSYQRGIYLQGNWQDMDNSVAEFRPLIRHNLLYENGYSGIEALCCHPQVTSNKIILTGGYAPVAVYYGAADASQNYIEGAQGTDGIQLYLCVTGNVDANEILHHSRGVYSWAYYDAGNPYNQWITDWLAGRQCTTNVRDNLFGYNDPWDAYLTDGTTGSVYGNDTLTPPLKMYLH